MPYLSRGRLREGVVDARLGGHADVLEVELGLFCVGRELFRILEHFHGIPYSHKASESELQSGDGCAHGA